MEPRSLATDWKKNALGLFEKRWYSYAIAGAGVLIATPAAHANTIYSGVQNLNTAANCNTSGTCPATSSTLTIDLDLGGSDGQFKLSGAVSSSTDTLNFIQGTTANIAGMFRNGGATPLFTAGQSIGPGGAASTDVTAGHVIGPEGTFTTADGFLGVQFNFGGGGPNFGWVHIQTSHSFNSGTGAMSYTINVVDWAFNDQINQSIAAGQTGVTPEPATAGLSLLALGACGLAAWRKRKQAA